MGTTRKALLIGVANAPGATDAFQPLDDPVTADLHQLGSTLEGAGYEVTRLHNPTRAEVGIGILEASRDLAADATLLLYFTGHGIRIGDTDYLVPHDARAPQDGSWQQPYLDTLLPADISGSLSECRTGTVLWAIDACRDTAGSAPGSAFGSRALQGPPSGRYALLLGCSAGQRSGYTADGSFFARGLAEAMGPLTAARTVQEVYESARASTRRAAHRHDMTQQVSIHYVPDHEHEVKSSQICEGRQLLESWREAVDGGPLWGRVRDKDARTVPRLKECLVTLVEECARTVHAAQERLPDPWADDDFPVRLLQRRLPSLLPEGACLSGVEAAALIAAPFLYEAAWADRLSHAAELEPLETTVRPGGDAHRRLYEQICDHHGHIARKVADCLRHERVEDAQSVALWLVHRWIAERFETDEAPIPETAARRFAAALLGQGDPASDRVDELATALGCLAAAVGVEQIAGELSTAMSPLPLSVGHQPLRIRPLTALLHLAGVLSADARACPPVMAEHLAVSDPVLPQTIVQVAREMDWETTSEGLQLDALSPHPATHAALLETAERADLYAGRLRSWAAELPSGEAELLARIPTRVTDRRLRPRRTDGQQAYEVPLLRFHLAQTEVRELLMGEHLYGGEPQLALRELYQNAMDACRFRAMRWAYLTSVGRCPASWTGRIGISRGSDSRGTYVDCVDNGVGMGVEQLKNTFAEAGSRFERSRSFRREQATWLRHDQSLRLYPNSRFGIGVFSYFMLAEEMTITTRQVAPDGSVSRDAVRVDIPGSGSLFRIQHDDRVDEDLRYGGTRVRLYLRDDEALQNISCVQSLRDQIGVAEFRLDVSDGPDRIRAWEAGTLRRSPAVDANGALEAVPGELWWVRGQGAILCDGIMTDQRPTGYVLNLRGPHAGELSVDRKTLQSYDRSWAESLWRRGAKSLLDWRHLDLPWLWELDRSSTPVARVLWEEWRGRHVEVPLGDRTERAYDLDHVGWFHRDGDVLRDMTEHRPRSEQLVSAWRRAVYGSPSERYQRTPPTSLLGYPVPEPGDAHCLTATGADWRNLVIVAADQAMTLRDVVHGLRRNRLAHPAGAPPRMTEPGPRWQPTELDYVIALGLDGSLQKTADGWEQTSHSELAEPTDFTGLVRASEAAGVALDELVARCGRYEMFLPAPLPEVPLRERGHVCTEREVRVLFSDDESELRSTRWPWQIERAAEQLQIEVHEVWELVSRFAWLGFKAPTAEELHAWLQIDNPIRELMRPNLETGADQVLELNRRALVSGAEGDGVSVAEIDGELALAAERIGAVHPRLDAEEVGGQKIDVDMLARWRPGDMDSETFADVLGRLVEAGVPVPPGAAELFRRWDDLPFQVNAAISGTDLFLRGRPDYPVTPSPARLFAASRNLGEPLGSMHSLLLGALSETDWDLPFVPPDLESFRVTAAEQKALQKQHIFLSRRSHKWLRLSADRLAEYALDRALSVCAAYRQLARFRPLGALVPVMSAEAVAALPDTVPTQKDVEVFNASYRLSDPDDPLTPLDLVSLAGQFGESVLRTRARFEPYLALLPGESLPDAPDVVPLWQDLIVLSVYLDGLLPALSGTVTAEQVAFAADGVEESATWVVRRLGVYAEAFGLDLSEVADRG